MSTGIVYPIVSQMLASEYMNLMDQVFGGNGSPLEIESSEFIGLVAVPFSGPVVGMVAFQSNAGPNPVILGEDWINDPIDVQKSSLWMPSFEGEALLSPPGLLWWSVPSGGSQSNVEAYLKSPATHFPPAVYALGLYGQAYDQYTADIAPFVVSELVLSQNAEDVLFVTSAAASQNLTQTGKGQTIENGVVQSSAINKVTIFVPKDGVPLTDTLSFTADATASTSSSTTSGVSNTSSISVGASLQLGIKDVASLGVNASLQQSTTVNTSTTTSSTQSVSLTQSNSITITVKPGQSILAEQTYLQQTTSIPFEAPVELTGNVVAEIDANPNSSSGSRGALSSMGSDDISPASALNLASTTYGYFPASIIQSSGTDSSAGTATVLTEGEVTNVNVGEFLATDEKTAAPSSDATAISTVKVYSTPSTSFSPASALQRAKPVSAAAVLSTALLTPEQVLAKKVSSAALPTVEIDGVESSVGLYYTPDSDWGDHLAGGDLDDLIYMTRDGQIAYTHAGNDRVIGSESGDRIYLGDGNDQVEASEGKDEIVSRSGAHLIDGGQGDDRIELFLGRHQDDLGVHTLITGAGQDQVHLHKEDREFTSVVAWFKDFSAEDRLKLHGFDDVTGEIIAGSLYLKENDRFFSKFQGYAGGVSLSNGRSDVIEHALLNARAYGEDVLNQASLQGVVNHMATHTLLKGMDPLSDYSELRESKSDVYETLVVIADLFDIDSMQSFLRRGVSLRDDFSTITDLVDHLLTKDPRLAGDGATVSDLVGWW